MLLITGATGTVGRPLVEMLVGAGAEVRAVSRSPVAVPGVEVVEGDPARPASLVPHLAGVTGLFLHPRAVGDAAFDLVALAREHGVRRVVALAASNVDEPLSAQPSRFRGDRNAEAEAAAVASGLEWVSLRPGTFAVNALGAWAAQMRAGDVVRYPFADFTEALVHERDLAAVAAHALLTDDLLGRRPVLTGPESRTHAELIGVLGEVLGRPLRYVDVPPAVATEAMVRNGFPAEFVDTLMSRYAAGAPAVVTDEVATILGRPAATFAEWVREHAAAFAKESR